MDHNPPTMGDLAFSEANRAVGENMLLRAKVESLEIEVRELREELTQWSNTIADAVNSLAEFVGYPDK